MNRHSATVIISEDELHGYMDLFPTLERLEVLHAIVSAGPWRAKVEEELNRCVARKATRQVYA